MAEWQRCEILASDWLAETPSGTRIPACACSSPASTPTPQRKGPSGKCLDKCRLSRVIGTGEHRHRIEIEDLPVKALEVLDDNARDHSFCPPD